MGLMGKWQNRSPKGVGAQGPAPQKRKIFRVLGWILVIPVSLVVVYVLFNQFDAELDPGIQIDYPSPKDSDDNSYWLLWALREPVDVDIRLPEVRQMYREMIKPEDVRDEAGKKALRRYSALKTFDSHFIDMVAREQIREKILQEKGYEMTVNPQLAVLLKRLQMIIDSPRFMDMNPLDAGTPIPDMRLLIRAVRLLADCYLHKAVRGAWLEGAKAVLKMIDCGKRMSVGSRSLIINIMARLVIKEGIDTLAYIINQSLCPKEVFHLVLTGLPEIHYAEYGFGNSMVCEALTWMIFTKKMVQDDVHVTKNFWFKLFLQKNRTTNLFHQWSVKSIARDQTPPFQWEKAYTTHENITNTPFWWLQNPSGKRIFDMVAPNLFQLTYASNRTKALYDMLRLSAWLHIHYDGTRTVTQLMSDPDCPALIDACSGGPFCWNEEKQVLYSIGVDLEDNGGETLGYQQIDGSDYALPVVLYVK